MILAEIDKLRVECDRKIQQARDEVTRECREEFNKELDPLKAQNLDLSSKL